MSKPSKSCALAFGKLSISPKAYTKHNTKAQKNAKSVFRGFPGRSLAARIICFR